MVLQADRFQYSSSGLNSATLPTNRKAKKQCNQGGPGNVEEVEFFTVGRANFQY